jgi:hypothetical protein
MWVASTFVGRVLGQSGRVEFDAVAGGHVDLPPLSIYVTLVEPTIDGGP